MRRRLPPADVVVIIASVLAALALLFTPLIDGFVRVHLLDDLDHRALVVSDDGGGRLCVAPFHAELCWPWFLYPVLVPGWWVDRLS